MAAATRMATAAVLSERRRPGIFGEPATETSSDEQRAVAEERERRQSNEMQTERGATDETPSTYVSST